MKEFFRRLSKARKNQLAQFEDKPDWQKGLGSIVVHRFLGALAFPFFGVIFLLGYAIYKPSLEAFAFLILSFASCVIIFVPMIIWYLKTYGEENS